MTPAEPPILRALIVDDCAAQRRLLDAVLAQLGIVADHAVDGREAIMFTADIPYDLILMDVAMPVMDGLCAIRVIRARERARDVTPAPIYVVTATDTGAARAASRLAGADGHIPKPADMQQLFEALQHGMEAKLAA